MAAGLNKVFLMGNLTRDPEVRYAPNGTAITNFSMAINRQYALETGEKKEDVCFVKVVVFGRRAEVCGEYLAKGSGVLVEGRLQSRSWEGQDGQKRNTLEVVANNVQFIGRGKGQSSPMETSDVKGEEHIESPAGIEEVVKEGVDEEVPF